MFHLFYCTEFTTVAGTKTVTFFFFNGNIFLLINLIKNTNWCPICGEPNFSRKNIDYSKAWNKGGWFLQIFVSLRRYGKKFFGEECWKILMFYDHIIYLLYFKNNGNVSFQGVYKVLCSPLHWFLIFLTSVLWRNIWIYDDMKILYQGLAIISQFLFKFCLHSTHVLFSLRLLFCCHFQNVIYFIKHEKLSGSTPNTGCFSWIPLIKFGARSSISQAWNIIQLDNQIPNCSSWSFIK
jgi:hypothetical protein